MKVQIQMTKLWAKTSRQNLPAPSSAEALSAMRQVSKPSKIQVSSSTLSAGISLALKGSEVS